MSLIGPEDPAPVRCLNPTAERPVLLLADHAGRAVPRALKSLGLEPESLSRHIAWDIGIAEVTERLSARLQATAMLGVYSRLIVDLNRALEDPTAIPVISDTVVIPANRKLDRYDIEARVRSFFDPYHQAVAQWVAGRQSRGQAPALISLHSFTPVMHDFARPWQIGILWDRDPRLPLPLMAALAAQDPSLCIGDNQPYSGRNTGGGTLETHATPAGLPCVLIEIRQDLIDTPEGAAFWADRLAEPLATLLADPALYQCCRYPAHAPPRPPRL